MDHRVASLAVAPGRCGGMQPGIRGSLPRAAAAFRLKLLDAATKAGTVLAQM